MCATLLQEALTGTVTIEDTRPDVVNIVLNVIYNGGKYQLLVAMYDQ